MASGAGETVVHVESAQPAPVTGATPSAPSTPANPAGGGALGNTPGHSHAASDLVVEEALEARPELPGTESLLRLVGQVDATKSPAADGAAGSNPGGAPGDAQGGDVAVDTTLSKAGQVLSRREILQKKGGFSEAKLAAEAAEAAQTAAHEAEQALAIAQAAAATAAAVEEEDDGLTLRSTAVEEIKDEESGAGVEEVRAVVPLTKTKHTLSFRFLGREMLEGKSFQDPDRAAAREHFRMQVFLRGKASLCTRSKDLAPLGAGVNLYLNLLCYLAVLMLLLSVLAVPTFLLAMDGSRIPDEDMDPMGLGKFTLGNNGFAEVATNTNATAATHNATVVTMAGRELTSIEASRILTAADFIGSVLILFFILFFKWRISALTHALADHTINMGDYAVFVKGLPKDATKEEVLNHFNSLYDLSKPGWTFKGYCCCLRVNGRKTGRPPVENKAPVSDFSNTGSALYEGKWVSEVSMAYKNGATLRSFSKLRKLLHRVTEAKYAVQRFAPESKHADTAKHAKAKRKVANLEADLSNAQKLYKLRDVESNHCVGAFVTFQHAQSAYRCQADYDYLCSRRCQPPPLRFRGKYRLKVEEAAPPSDVLWMNIETSKKERFLRRALTNSVLLLLLVASFVLIVLAQKQKEELNEQLPRLDMCDMQLPAAAYQTYDFPADAKLRRVRSKDDTTCGAGEFYLEWYDPTNSSAAPIVGHDTCTANCQKTSDSTTCHRLDGAGTYPLSTVVGCYCLDVLKEYINEHGVFSGAAKAQDDEGDLCIDSLQNYAAAQSLLLVAAMSVVFINFVLQRVLKALARFERHDTVSHEQLSITIKVFLAQLLNTGVIVLIVHARLPNTSANDPVLSKIGMFSGDHDGFGVGWYSTVGVSIMITMLIQTIFPHLMPLMQACILRPCKRSCCWRFKASQDSLNRLYKPQNYDLSQRYPVLLNTLFVTLMYSAGLPLLLPLAMFSFIFSYWVDRLLLLRYTTRPPHYNESLAKLSLQLLPVGLVLHLCFAIWMFGNSEVLKSDIIDASVLDGTGDGTLDVEEQYEVWKAEQEADWDTLGVTTKIVRENVFPLFFLLVLIIVLLVIVRLALTFFVKSIVSVFHLLTCGKCTSLERLAKRMAKSLDQEHDGGFTDQFMDPVSVPYVRRKKGESDKEYGDRVEAKLQMKLNMQDEIAGWRMVVSKNTKGLVTSAHAMKEWTDDGISEVGLVHRKDTPLRVWEVILESGGVYSYHPMANPKFTKLFVSMRQAQHKVNTVRRRMSVSGRGADSAAAKQAAAYAAQVAYAQRLAEQQALYARNVQQQRIYQAQLAQARARAAAQARFVAQQQAYARQQAQYAQQHAQYAQQHGMAAAVSGVARTVQTQQAAQAQLAAQQQRLRQQQQAHAVATQQRLQQRQAMLQQQAQQAARARAQQAQQRARMLAAMSPEQRQQHLLAERRAQQARLLQQQQAIMRQQQAQRAAYLQRQAMLQQQQQQQHQQRPPQHTGYVMRASAPVAPQAVYVNQLQRRNIPGPPSSIPGPPSSIPGPPSSIPGPPPG